MPLLNLRAVRPARLVDINRAGLGVIRRRDGVLHLGATVRQAALERSSLVAERWPLLAEAVRHVGHPATRSRGTVGGSVVHADPRAQLPAALAALGRALRSMRAPLLVSIERPAAARDGRGPRMPSTRARAASSPTRARPSCSLRGHAGVALLGTGRATRAERRCGRARAPSEAAALAAEEVEGDHRRALVADVTRRALERAGRR